MIEENLVQDEVVKEEVIKEDLAEEESLEDEIVEERVFIEGQVKIGATISYKDKEEAYPAVILITGTGELDRDGNLNQFVTNFYKDLAAFFVAGGCVAIRYDKRGLHETEGDYSTASLSDYTNDAVALVKYARSLDFVDATKVLICGHSEGAMIGTLVAKDEDLAGLILIGGAGISLLDVQLNQNRLMMEEINKTKGIRGWFMRLQTSQRGLDANVRRMFKRCTKTKKNIIKYGPSTINAKWIREHAAYTSEDYARMLKEFEKPVLAITGKADLVMDYKHHDNLSNVENAEVYTPDNVNHMLREIDDDNSLLTTAQQYMRLAKKAIHAQTAEKMEEWIKKNFLV